MKVLYLGLDFQKFNRKKSAYHYPVIKIIPKPISVIKASLTDLSVFTHYIFTSPRSVSIFCTYLKAFNKFSLVQNKPLIAIGKSTNAVLAEYNLFALVAKLSTQEGIISLLKKMNLDKSHFLIPRSSIARKTLDNFLKKNQIKFQSIDIYDTEVNNFLKKINLEDFEEIFFTSPSTVKAFVQIFKKIPSHLKLTAIGPITQKAINQHLK